jgi:hypothetical protein
MEIAMNDPQYTIEMIDDAAEVARCRAQDARAKKNSDWLQAHWADILPDARGKFVAVAGEEAFIADTVGRAWEIARAAHPEDDGAISQYVFPEEGLRIYAHRR